MAEVTRKQYTAKEKGLLISKVERLVRAGQGILSACRQVGISSKSFHNWRKIMPMRQVEVTALVPVAPTALTLAPPKAALETLALLAPGGYRIEGLSVTSAAALLKALL